MSAPSARLATRSIAALGVVFGDLGTSPLYALQDAFSGHHGIAATRANVVGVVSLFVWVRGTFPRYRYDQIMRLGWKVFIPLTLFWLVVVAAWMQTSWNIWK